jgi:hypothetical protein
MKIVAGWLCGVMWSGIAVTTLCHANLCFADRDEDGQGDQEQALRPSIKQYDPRLPPVLPGEEVVTEQGQKMRVWSSAGPVPVNPQPTPQSLQGLGLGGVIIDGRVPPGGRYAGEGEAETFRPSLRGGGGQR